MNCKQNISLAFAIVGSCCFLSLMAQPYDVAPRVKKKVHRIVEWVSPAVGSTSTKGMVSTFDRAGNLIAYTSDEEAEILNTTYLLDQKGRPKEVQEGQGSQQIKTTYLYKPDRTIKDERIRGKLNRTILFYDKKGKLLELKAYSKGLELGNSFRLKEQIFYQYNTRGQLITEEYRTYSLPKSDAYNARKNTYYYHPKSGLLMKVVEYDYDQSPSVVKDYSYYQDGKVKSIITTFKKDKTYATKEFKYKAGLLWQRITTEQGLRHVEIFVDGRLIRLRSYNDDKIYRVVDYQYEYY